MLLKLKEPIILLVTEAKIGIFSLIEQLKAQNPDLVFSAAVLDFLKQFEAGQTDGISCWRDESLERRQGSNIQGVGLFSNADIDPNHVIAIKPGHVVTEEIIRENAEVIKGTHQQIGPNSFLAGLTAEEADKNLVGYNHSCDPNAKVVLMEGLPLAFLVSKKPIEKGAEITTDYSVTFTSDTQEMSACKCGSINCRGHIQPNEDWKNERFQREHFDDFPYYIREMIKATKQGD